MTMLLYYVGGKKAHSPELFFEVSTLNSPVKTPELVPSAALLEKHIFSYVSVFRHWFSKTQFFYF